MTGRRGLPVARRFAPRAACAGFAFSLAAATRPASAQDDSESVSRAERNDYSPQNAAFELRFGPYRPKIDESTAAPVYSDFFGDGRRFMFGFEVDWQALRVPFLGTLGLGFGLGYTQMSATNLVPADVATEGLGRVSQESSLNILPLHGVLVARVDTFARNLYVPLVPYAKLGVAHAFWWVNDGLGTATSNSGTTGKDTSTGTFTALGGMLLLDFLEPSAALEADNESGVNNSYLFFEWMMTDYGGDQMNVGTSTWVTGLAFEM